MHRYSFSIGVYLTIFTAAYAATVMGESLTDAKYDELRNLLQPAEDEPWRTIPWKITLLEAQRLAARETKPIFIWAMDGHPLGCT